MKKIVLIVLAIIVVLAVAAIVATENYTARSQFCGATCHIMKKPYESWKTSKHKDVACVDCHYAPGEKQTREAKFKGLAQLFSYLSEKPEDVSKFARISDISCTTSKCHPKTGEGKEGEYWTKRVNYTEYERSDKSKAIVSIIHKTHDEKTIEGQKLHCQTCHSHQSAEKHFEVSPDACFLCHFKNTTFGEGRAKCSLCHEIPTMNLQKEGKNPTTHQTLEKAKVPCSSCHWELVSGTGEIKKEDCLDCHDDPIKLEKATDKKLMHEKHIAEPNANCRDCHRPDIQHKKIVEYLDPARENCRVCHIGDQHLYQKKILMGEAKKGVAQMPSPMLSSHTSCVGCHIEEGIGKKGARVMGGSPRSCSLCHTKDYEQIIKDDIALIKKELEAVLGLEKKAEEAIAGAKGKVTKEKLKIMTAMFKDAQSNLHIVEYGGGAHNKKYAMSLIDVATMGFENVMDSLDEQ